MLFGSKCEVAQIKMCINISQNVQYMLILLYLKAVAFACNLCWIPQDGTVLSSGKSFLSSSMEPPEKHSCLLGSTFGSLR